VTGLAMTLPLAVYVIWWTVLLLVALVIVPLALFLLHSTLRSAQDIRRYFAEMLQAGVMIAEHTGAVAAREHTETVAKGMVATAQNLGEHSQAVAELLQQRAAGSPP